MPTAWCRHCDAAVASAKHVHTCMPTLTTSEQLEALLERVAEHTVSPSQGTTIIAKFIVQLVHAAEAKASCPSGGSDGR